MVTSSAVRGPLCQSVRIRHCSNHIVPCNRPFSMSLRENKEWQDFFRSWAQGAILMYISTCETHQCHLHLARKQHVLCALRSIKLTVIRNNALFQSLALPTWAFPQTSKDPQKGSGAPCKPHRTGSNPLLQFTLIKHFEFPTF